LIRQVDSAGLLRAGRQQARPQRGLGRGTPGARAQGVHGIDLDFDIGVTGFTIAEVDQLVEGLAPEEPGDPADDKLPDPDRVPPRCKPGHVRHLGPHRLVCGDALDPEVVVALMDGEKAEMVFTDPPYNVAIEGNVSGLGKIRRSPIAPLGLPKGRSDQANSGVRQSAKDPGRDHSVRGGAIISESGVRHYPG
jgi:hypothetical protein